MYRITSGLVLLLVCCGWFACQEEAIQPPATDALDRYYPLALGQEATYAVDSILLIPEVGGIRYDTSLLTVREILVDTFTSASGQRWFRGERFEKDRTAPDSDYQLTATFARGRTDRQALYRQDNLTFTALTLPARVGESWRGFDFDEFRSFVVGGEFLDVYNGWQSRYEATNETVEIEGRTYEEVLFVERANVTDNLIDLRTAYARYAPEVGLIESFVDARHTQCQVCCNGDTAPCFDLPWDEKAEKGFILRTRRIQ